MSNSSDKPIDPFQAARHRVGINVELQSDDVQALRPQWSDEQARMFLDRNAVVIAHTMLAAGMHVLRQLLEVNDHDC